MSSSIWTHARLQANAAGSGRNGPHLSADCWDHRGNLCRLWRQWTIFVERVAGHKTSSGLGPQEYKALHRTLMRAVEESASQAEGKEKAIFEDTLTLLSPWGSLDVLGRADGEILGDLLCRCWEIERRYDRRWWVRALRGWTKWVVGLAAAIVGVVVAAETADRGLFPLLHWGEDSLKILLWNIRWTSEPVMLFAIGVLVTVGGIMVVSRSSRT